MSEVEPDKLIGEEEIAHLRRILVDTPLETDEDYAEIGKLVEDESEE